MSDRDRTGASAPGWLFDEESGRTRWWDGARWTDLAKPLDPVVRTTAGAAYRPVSASSAVIHGRRTAANGPSAWGLGVALLAGIAIGAALWLPAAADPVPRLALTVATGVLVAVAFALSIAGVVTAIHRPTGKTVPVIALALSSLLVSVVAFGLLAGFTP